MFNRWKILMSAGAGSWIIEKKRQFIAHDINPVVSRYLGTPTAGQKLGANLLIAITPYLTGKGYSYQENKVKAICFEQRHTIGIEMFSVGAATEF